MYSFIQQTLKNTPIIMENIEPDEIQINDFLKFLKTSCHVNDLIRDSKDSKSTIAFDFDELASNKIIKNLYGLGRKSVNCCENTKTLSPSKMDYQSEKSSKNDSYNGYRIWKRQPLKGMMAFTDFENQKPNIHPKLANRLDNLINEGVLDSVLPYVCPFVPPKKVTKPKTTTNNESTTAAAASAMGQSKSLPTVGSGTDVDEKLDTKESTSMPRIAEEGGGGDGDSPAQQKDSKGMLRRKPSAHSHLGVSTEKEINKIKELEVVIHVCDELKGTSRDFTCSKNLLVSKMGYFTDVTAGQKLEDMDISVHCDIQIFEWLMKWVKGTEDLQQEAPQLDATNVVPILVSASFLQMEPLLLDCLSFCHARLSDIVRTPTNLSCLNDSIITRLAAMFTNLELEVVKDKKERVTPRLWTKLIQSLAEPEPQALRGHYFSLAGLFRCARCSKCLTQTMSSYITCVPSNTRLNRWGQLVSQHVRDPTWDLSHYISTLFKELKSWRKVYWKLWGHCHYLYCCICETHFPVYQMTWCRFHSDVAQFLGPFNEGRAAGPAGRYLCCGQQAFRYEALPGPNGCQFREHSVLIENDRDRAILNLVQIASEGGNLFERPPANLRDDHSTEPRWIGLCLMPTKCRPGLLPVLNPEESTSKLSRHLRLGAFHDSSSETDNGNTPDRFKQFTPRYFSTSSDGCESDGGSVKRIFRRRTRRKHEPSGRFWSGELSARSNQDHQREFEEKIMKQVTMAVGKRTGSNTSTAYGNSINSGTYVRLEAEWKEQLKQKNASKKFK